MIRQDYHMHTTFCDGRNSAEEMVLAAIGAGMTHIGITTHSYTDFDSSYCIPKERIGEYRAAIARLKEAYRDRITILCGVEQDLWGTADEDSLEGVFFSMLQQASRDENPAKQERAKLAARIARQILDGQEVKLP